MVNTETPHFESMSSADSAQEARPTPVLAYSLPELADLMGRLSQPRFRTKQLIEWLYKHNAPSFSEMTTFPASLREQLSEVAPLQRACVVQKQVSSDGTRKYLIEFADGTRVEAVGLPTRDRLTACVSSQAGCAMGCTFCATGAAGFERNLAPGELAEQVRIIAEDFGERVSNVVVMGQGEPFANYDAVLAGLRILNSPDGFNIGARHITVSTCGLVEQINRFAEEPEQFVLAVSLHSAVQETRNRIMPGVKGNSLKSLQRALVRYFSITKRRPSLEFALIDGVQTSEREMAALTEFAREVGAHVNLIPVNPVAGSNVVAPSAHRVAQIAKRLQDAGVNATVRTERGSDIAAACGQLAGSYKP